MTLFTTVMPFDSLAFYKSPAGLWQNIYLEQKVHQITRNAVYAKKKLEPGTILMEEKVLSSVLLPEAKGSRCDCCLREGKAMKRCSGCAAYFYCDTVCK